MSQIVVAQNVHGIVLAAENSAIQLSGEGKEISLERCPGYLWSRPSFSLNGVRTIYEEAVRIVTYRSDTSGLFYPGGKDGERSNDALPALFLMD
jgi:hypothetical protein